MANHYTLEKHIEELKKENAQLLREKKTPHIRKKINLNFDKIARLKRWVKELNNE